MDRLQHRYEGGVEQLCAIFRDIGYDEAERKRVLENLTERVITVVDAVVEEQERTRLALEKNIEDTANAIGQVSAALGKNAPEMPVTADVPLKVLLQRYQEQYAVLRKDKAEAMAQLTAEWKKLHQLWDELGTPRNPADGYEGDANTFDSAKEFSQIDESKLGINTIRRYKAQVQHWGAERETRAKALAEMSALVTKLEAQLGEVDTVSHAPAHDLSFRRINEMKARFDALQATLQDRMAKLDGQFKTIQQYYEILQTPPAERLTLTLSDLSKAAMDKYEREAHRLASLKTTRMKELIERAVDDLRAQYAELGLEEGRIHELCAPNKAWNEEMLQAVQHEVAQTKAVIASCREITQLIPTREKLRALAAEVHARSQDPERLKSKSRGLQLIEEQKQEAHVKRALPATEAKLMDLIASWEAKHGRDFIYGGVRYVEAIIQSQREDEMAVAERKARIADRKMRDLDSSMFVGASAGAGHHNTSVMAPRAAPAPAASATVRVPSKTQARTQRDEGPQSARPATKTASRTMETPTARPAVAAVADTTPVNVAARRNPVSVSRATPSVRPLAATGSSEAQLTTPVTGGGGKYAKVKSKVNSFRPEPTPQPLAALHNTPPKRGRGGQ